MALSRRIQILIAAAAVALMTGCFRFNAPEECPSGDEGLRITAPASGAAIPGGDDTTIAYSYSSSYAYDTLQIFAGAAVVCTTELTGRSASGTCPWNTTGLATGPIELTLEAIDLRTTPLCPGVSARRAVTITATAPTIDTHPTDTAANEGTTASFTATARGSGPLTLQWERSDDDGAYVDVPGASTTTLNLSTTTAADDGALFRLVAANPEGSATSDPARLEVCPRPPLLEFDRSAPPPATPPAVTYSSNLLVDPGFESPVRVGLAPTGFGYWRFDESVSAPAQQGVAPRNGTRMLQFVGSSRDIALSNGTASELGQLVDVSALRGDIDAELVEVRAAAHYARVAGCSTTDDAFFVIVVAFDGEPGTFGTRWSNGINAAVAQGVPRDDADMTGVDGWLLHRQTRIRHVELEDRVGDVFDWRRVEVTADLPAGTTFVALILAAQENVANEAAFPEFHGHYADDAEVVLTLREP